ncbi:MAG: hypothetical protein KGL95_12335 [Patescibacteria group bacterium]|nr:hypothetical protein [Patescibacteria group bacterium]
MNALVIDLVLVCIAVSGIILYTYIQKTTTNAVLRLSATAEITPGNVRVHTQQDLYNMNSGTILDNFTLDKIPVLKNAIDRAFGKFTPRPLSVSILLRPTSTKMRLTLY